MNDDLTARIAQRAYCIWENENRPEGKDIEHWLCAEAEVTAEQAASVSRRSESNTPKPQPDDESVLPALGIRPSAPSRT